MYVPYKILVQMLQEAYERGRQGSAEMRSETVDDLIAMHKVCKVHDFRMYSVDELRQFPVGTRFCHSQLGPGEVVSKPGLRQPFMKFENGMAHQFSGDVFPWDMPMLYLGECEKPLDKR